MIEKNKPFNDFDVYCDFCDFCDSFDVDDNWDELMNEMKEDGWKSKKVEEEWKHMCPDCVDKNILWEKWSRL
ncbi:MAG: hypothetical protein M0P47_12940 [Bacteroidales bacterium]|jgi:Fe2+ or Zn2+ uptake regulation protein|nr:hypothetical protein [Bacteroidales bacterium]